jgi:hypothetical protein
MCKIVRSEQKKLDKIVRKENNVTRSGTPADMLCSRRNATDMLCFCGLKKDGQAPTFEGRLVGGSSLIFLFAGEDR